MGFVSGQKNIHTRRAALMTALALPLLFAAPAWSFDTHHASLEIPVSSSSGTPPENARVDSISSPSVTDTCLPLLSIRQMSPHTVADWNQRPAGKAAAFGLIFGVRFALGPVEKTKARSVTPDLHFIGSDNTKSDRSALAVSAYRQCRKEQALNAYR